LARLECGCWFCHACVMTAVFDQGGGDDLRTCFMCPKCSQLCVMVERVQKPSGSLVDDPFGGPLRDVAVYQADAQGGFTMADSTWKASYYSATIKDHCLPMIATEPPQTVAEIHKIELRLAQMYRKALAAQVWPKVRAAHETVDSALSALKWDAEAEAFRALIRQGDILLDACRQRLTQANTGSEGPLSVGSKVWIFGLVNGPEYNGLSGRVTEVLPPKTLGNSTKKTRYGVTLSVGGVVSRRRSECPPPRGSAADR